MNTFQGRVKPITPSKTPKSPSKTPKSPCKTPKSLSKTPKSPPKTQKSFSPPKLRPRLLAQPNPKTPRKMSKKTDNLTPHCETWFKHIQADLKLLRDKNFDLEKEVNKLTSEAKERDRRITNLEGELQTAKRADLLKEVDEESKTLMLSGLPKPNRFEDRKQALQKLLDKNLPTLNKDINLYRPVISFNSPDAKTPTAFLKFNTKSEAFTTSKNLKGINKGKLYLRSCIPEDIRKQKEQIIKDFKENNANAGLICQVILGSKDKRGRLVVNTSPDPKDNGSKAPIWKHNRDVHIIPDLPPPTPAILQDPIQLPLQCIDMETQLHV